MIGPLDDSLVLTTATRRFWSTGQVWTSFPLPPWYGIPWDQIIFSELGTFFLSSRKKIEEKTIPINVPDDFLDYFHIGHWVSKLVP
jgi:hypothetical protein